MINHNQDGAVNGLLLSLILTVILLLAAIGFGGWAYSSRQDYKDHTDAKIDTAVAAAVKKNSADKDKQFAEDYKKPLKPYQGPQALGSISMMYPKTWSAYVKNASDTSLDVYFNPDVVTSVDNSKTPFALRVRVLGQSYTDALEGYSGKQKSGKVTISAYALPKLPNVVGSKIAGQITGDFNGTIVLLPLRSQTIQIETDNNQYLPDYNNYILPNFSFSP